MATASRTSVWIGRVITAVVAIMFGISAFFKFVGGEAVTQGMAHLQLSESMVKPLGVLESACVVIYLIPATSILGAILLTGYIGGVILTHLRVGDPLYIPIALGIAIWLGLWLRESRLKELMPLRKSLLS